MEIGLSKSSKKEFWSGKRVVLTGHTGFKGAWMALWLSRLGAQVTGISLAPEAQPNLFELANINSITHSHFCDIRDSESLSSLMKLVRPEIIFHFAAQSLVRAGYTDPLATFSTNIQGTANILDSLRTLETARVAVVITTDKVYRNLEQQYPFRETDELGGHDPYSASKAAAEIVIASYRDSYLKEAGIAVASARAGNVIGGGDWAENRLIPDAIRAWQMGRSLEVRRPHAIRPWQHVLEPLAAYIKLAERLWVSPSYSSAFNFGPMTHEAATVQEVVLQAKDAYGMGRVVWGNSAVGPHEAGWLALETAKARRMLGLEPRWPLFEAVRRTIYWYKRLHEGSDARELCCQDIADYEEVL